MTKAVKVVLNEQHQLLENQKAILNDCFGDGWEIFPIPAKGMTLPEMEDAIEKLKGGNIVFASPVPVMLMKLSALSASESEKIDVMVFHNDNRQKKELGNGKIIYVVAEFGWELVKAL